MSKPDFPRTSPPYFGIDELIVLLWGDIWPPRDFDKHMRERMTGALNLIRPPGHFVVGIVGRVDGRRPIWCMMPQNLRDEEAVRAHFGSTELPPANAPAGKITPMPGSRFQMIYRDMKDLEMKEECAEEPCAAGECWPARNSATGFVALILTREGDPGKEALERFVLICYRALLPLFFDVFRHRENVMKPFAPAISELYWRAESKPGENLPRPPWRPAALLGRPRGERYTFTLSLDLRKSTLCMDQADDASAFGHWLGRLVEEMTKICHAHCGVFDKFTGDGGLMHFLNEECRHVCRKSAAVSAMGCARELRKKIGLLLPQMRENLRNDSELFGAGISIAAGQAYWDLDHRWNPIVVGPGVVDACRICDKTGAGAIRMSNRAYQLLRKDDEKEAVAFQQTLLGGNKEHPDADRLTGWELRE